MKRLMTLLAAVAFVGQAWAQDFDFSAVCGSGQTLYYFITSAKGPFTVSVIYPDHGETEFYVNYPKPEGNLVIPAEVENEGIKYKVTGICAYAFCSCSGLKSVTIPEGIPYINGYVFYGCSGLTSVTIPNSITRIEGWAFVNCSGLTTFTILDSVTSIGDCAFAGCSGLLTVTIPKTVEKIGNFAFAECAATINCEVENIPDGWDSDWLGVEKYKGKVVWGYKPTPITETAANAVNIYAYGRNIVVENATDEISVYDVMGKLICRDAINRVPTEIPVNTTGVYIVKVGNIAKRVVIN